MNEAHNESGEASRAEPWDKGFGSDFKSNGKSPEGVEPGASAWAFRNTCSLSVTRRDLAAPLQTEGVSVERGLNLLTQ